MVNFADRVIQKIEETGPLVLGLDPHFSLLPPFLLKKWLGREKTLENLSLCVRDFNLMLLEALAKEVGFVKVQMAFYEALGVAGMMVLKETIDKAKGGGLVVILDGKRNDIASSAEAYARGYLSEIVVGGEVFPSFWNVDALTVNPYLGRDSLEPFVEEAGKRGKGIFILARTTNSSASFLQYEGKEEKIFVKVARLAEELGQKFQGLGGKSPVGIVVGATYPEDMRFLREEFPNLLFLIPGIGTQKGAMESLVFGLGKDGKSALINVSRDILFAFRDGQDPEGFSFVEEGREKARWYQKRFWELMKR
ncbi:MAG: orotidine-5'-phosphate decarboxylase [Candidatus Caldatribacteriaceae bacterium]